MVNWVGGERGMGVALLSSVSIAFEIFRLPIEMASVSCETSGEQMKLDYCTIKSIY